ncbi:efflux transporter outer membrane subunit [Pedobacter jamesrossensis]|uniref:Efflux transporter outer membrane subunit n=1 Tax=Pedobacter jamesrossensis TaxID=1908238 RepID=A0ABV8NMD1_9SPHI
MMNFKYYFCTLVFAMLTASIWSSCSVSKNMPAPDMHLPAGFNNAAAVMDTNSISTVRWSDFFADQQLTNLISKAIERNNDLQIALKNIESAQLIFQQVSSANLPALGLQATSSINRPSDNSINSLNLKQSINTTHVQDYSLAAYISWEADIWGKIKSQKAASLASYLQTKEVRNVVQTRIVSEVAKGYYNLLMLDALLEISEKNLRLNDSTVNIVKLQFDAGLVSALAVEQAVAQRLSSEELIPAFQQRITLQENAINLLIGEFPSSVQRTKKLSDYILPERLSAGVPTELLSHRPDVRAVEFELARSNADVGYTKAQMYPSLTITALTGLDAFKASNWFNIPASLFGSAAANLTQPIFNQKKLRTQYELAKIQRESSIVRFRQSVLVAVEEVSGALLKLDKLKAQQNIEAQRASTLRYATVNSQLLFKNGLASYLEVLLAQGNVLQSELQLANLQKERLDAMVDLYRSVGGGWK